MHLTFTVHEVLGYVSSKERLEVVHVYMAHTTSEYIEIRYNFSLAGYSTPSTPAQFKEIKKIIQTKTTQNKTQQNNKNNIKQKRRIQGDA